MDTHLNMRRLVDDMDLTERLSCHDSSKTFLGLTGLGSDGYLIKSENDLMTHGFMDTCKNISQMIQNGQIDRDMARSHNLHGLLEKVYGIETADKISDEFGYDGDV